MEGAARAHWKWTALARAISVKTRSSFSPPPPSLIGAFLQGQAGRTWRGRENSAAAAMEAQNCDVLLREMQHRVKNNFQIILASIAIQKRRYSAGDADRALDHIASRINAIPLAHDQLAPREEGQIVKLSNYLRALCLSIKQQAEGIEVEVQADELELSIERAVPLGLILNEIATNSIKHAFGLGRRWEELPSD